MFLKNTESLVYKDIELDIWYYIFRWIESKMKLWSSEIHIKATSYLCIFINFRRELQKYNKLTSAATNCN